MPSVINYGAIRLLDVPHARALANEIFDEDCYNFDRIPFDTIVLDVGACYGEFAIRCAVEKRSRVVAYEPSLANLSILTANKELNKLSDDQLLIVPLAVGIPGQRSFLERPDHPAGSMFEASGKDHGCTGVVVNVTVVAIADQIKEARSRWGDLPVCVKMDCEGAEHEIFANTDWIDHVSLIALEWHNYDGDHFRSILERRGFSVMVEGGGPKPRPACDPTIGAGLLFAVRR